MAEPFVTYIGVTSPGGVTGTGTATIAYPGGHAANDIAVLVLETDGGETISTPTGDGWAVLTTAQASGTGVGSAGVQTFWKRLSSGAEADASIPYSSLNHGLFRLLVFRGAKTTGDPFEGGAGGDSGGIATTSPTLGTVTTAGDFRLIVDIVATGNDSAAARASAWDNQDTYVRTELSDDGTTAGNGGGLSINTGQTRKVGTLAASTLTITSAVACWTSFAFIPASTTPELPVGYPVIDDAVASRQTAATTLQAFTTPYRSAGQLLVLLGNFGQTLPTTYDLPGWTQFLNLGDPGVNTRAIGWYRVADGSEGQTVTVTTGANVRSEAIIYSISGWDTSATIEAAYGSHGTGTDPNPPSFIPGFGGGPNLWIAFAASSTNSATFTAYPYTQDQTTIANSSGNGGVVAASATQATDGPKDPGAFTLDTSSPWVATTIVVRGEGVEGDAFQDDAFQDDAFQGPAVSGDTDVNAGLASSTAAANAASVNVAPNAGNAAATGAANAPATSIKTNGGTGSATGSAGGPAPSLGSSAGTGAATGAANTPGTGRTAGIGTATGAANAPSVSVAPNAGAASATGAANAPSAAVATNGGLSSATGDAYGVAGAIQTNGGNSSASGAAGGPAPALGVNAGLASATAGAYDATVSVATSDTADAGLAEATGEAYGVAGAIQTNGGSGSASGVAGGPAPAIAPHADVASATGSAYDATISTAAADTADAGLAEATGEAYGVAAAIDTTGGTGSASGAANGPAPSLGVNAGNGAATGAANGVAGSVAPTSGSGSASGSAHGPAPAIAPTAGATSATGSAYDATVSTVANETADAGHASATGAANGASVGIGASAGHASALAEAFPASEWVQVNAAHAVATAAAYDATTANDFSTAGGQPPTIAAFHAMPELEVNHAQPRVLAGHAEPEPDPSHAQPRAAPVHPRS